MTKEINAALVKQLRDMTGSGMMSCKQALVESNGEIDAAVDWLRKKGLASASKKAGRVTAEGIVSLQVHNDKGLILETNSETDFVSRNDKFQNFVSKITDIAFNSNIQSVADLLAAEFITGYSVKDKMTELVAVIGENINIRRLECINLANHYIASYVHNTAMPNAGKIGVLVAFESNCTNDEALKSFGKFIAMHIAATNTLIALNKEELDPKILEREHNVLTEKYKQSGKPTNIIAKMVEGSMQKFYQESVLLEQAFFVEPSKTIRETLTEFSKKENCQIKISKYIKYVLGEGIEKENTNFAEEVMNQVKK